MNKTGSLVLILLNLVYHIVLVLQTVIIYEALGFSVNLCHKLCVGFDGLYKLFGWSVHSEPISTDATPVSY